MRRTETIPIRAWPIPSHDLSEEYLKITLGKSLSTVHRVCGALSRYGGELRVTRVGIGEGTRLTFIRQVEKEFDFLDYHFGPDGLTVIHFVEPRAKGFSSDEFLSQLPVARSRKWVDQVNQPEPATIKDA